MAFLDDERFADVAALLARPDAIPIVLMVTLLVLFCALSLRSIKKP